MALILNSRGRSKRTKQRDSTGFHASSFPLTYAPRPISTGNGERIKTLACMLPDDVIGTVIESLGYWVTSVYTTKTTADLMHSRFDLDSELQTSTPHTEALVRNPLMGVNWKWRSALYSFEDYCNDRQCDDVCNSSEKCKQCCQIRCYKEMQKRAAGVMWRLVVPYCYGTYTHLSNLVLLCTFRVDSMICVSLEELCSMIHEVKIHFGEVHPYTIDEVLLHPGIVRAVNLTYLKLCNANLKVTTTVNECADISHMCVVSFEIYNPRKLDNLQTVDILSSSNACWVYMGNEYLTDEQIRDIIPDMNIPVNRNAFVSFLSRCVTEMYNVHRKPYQWVSVSDARMSSLVHTAGSRTLLFTADTAWPDFARHLQSHGGRDMKHGISTLDFRIEFPSPSVTGTQKS